MASEWVSILVLMDGVLRDCGAHGHLFPDGVSILVLMDGVLRGALASCGWRYSLLVSILVLMDGVLRGPGM